MLNGSPDYVGYWVAGGPGSQRVQRRTNDFGSFRMFIDYAEEEGSNKKIKGRIKDKYGKANFEGTISPTEIRFIKKYDPLHSDIDVIKSDIIFSGSLSKETNFGGRFYEGKFEFLNEKKESILVGGFVLEKHTPSKTLEFLMRMNHK